MIVYAHELEEKRRRFTIAHELGHALVLQVTGSKKHVGIEVERICDMIAAEILMPKNQFLSQLTAPLSLKKLRSVAHNFNVSFQAAAKRCAELTDVILFSTEAASINWTSGRVRRGPIAAVEEPLKLAIYRALRGEHGDEIVYFDGSFQKWRCDRQPTRDGFWFLLEPLRKRLQV